MEAAYIAAAFGCMLLALILSANPGLCSEIITPAEDGEGTGLLNSMGEALLGEAAGWSSKQWLETLKSTLVNAVKRQYLYNDYFAGGLGLMLVGTVMATGRRLLTLVKAWLARARRGTVLVHIQPSDPAYQWLEEWLSKHSAKDSTSLNLVAKWPEGTDEYYSDEEYDESIHNKKKRPKILLVPKLQEAQKLAFQGEIITFQVESKASVLNKGEGPSELADFFKSVGTRDSLVISAASRGIIEALVKEAMEAALADSEGPKYTRVLRWSPDEFYWSQVASKVSRPLESVVLDVEASELVKDAQQFLSSAKWYADRGVPHRRGYLLYGPPGCGKSSTIMALAGELELGVSMIGLSAKQMSDEMLHSAMARVNQQTIMVLEDIDAAFTERKGESASTLSFSGLLNAIDGVGAQEGRILIMTTNHLERLDPALVRPGRCDMRLYLGLASRTQTLRMFRRFYPNASEADAEAFAAEVPEGTISPASLQGYFLLHRDSSIEALAKVEELLKEEAAKKGAPAVVSDTEGTVKSSCARSSTGASTSELNSSNEQSEEERSRRRQRKRRKGKKIAHKATKLKESEGGVGSEVNHSVDEESGNLSNADEKSEVAVKETSNGNSEPALPSRSRRWSWKQRVAASIACGAETKS